MAKPRLIILVRHAQSEGNRNRDIHQTTPDHRVQLTPDGWTQAYDAGRRLRHLLRPDDKLHFFTSPYRRTRDTTEAMLSTLTSDDPEPSPFRRSNIKVYEEPRLREQDFGNFQPCSAEMERMWQERADYGHFFYRIPNGESAADAYDRVSGFNESLWRQFGEDDFASVCVLVTHGLMSRVFLMKWYHFTVEYFEDLRNVNHCEFLIMRKEDNGKYLLETKLRTWSGLRKERSLIAAKDKDKEEHKDSSKDERKDGVKLERAKTAVGTRRWGGCPNGCNHTSHYKRREDLDFLREKDLENGNVAGSTTVVSRRQRHQQQRPAISSDDDGDDGDDGDDDEHCEAFPPPRIDVARNNRDEARSGSSLSLDGTTSANGRPGSALENPRHLHVGRDFGGTYSGHTSPAASDTEASDDGRRKRLQTRHSEAGGGRATNGVSAFKARDGGAASRSAAFANRLGDAGSDADEDVAEAEEAEMEDLVAAEKEDRSIAGSVY